MRVRRSLWGLSVGGVLGPVSGGIVSAVAQLSKQKKTTRALANPRRLEGSPSAWLGSGDRRQGAFATVTEA
jgi:hypothetical protein